MKTLAKNKYEAIRFLLDNGNSASNISKYVGVSLATISRVNKTKTYEEYLEEKEKRTERRNEYVEAKERRQKQEPIVEDLKLPEGTMSAAYNFNRIVELIKIQNEILRVMSNKVAFIVDELTK